MGMNAEQKTYLKKLMSQPEPDIVPYPSTMMYELQNYGYINLISPAWLAPYEVTVTKHFKKMIWSEIEHTDMDPAYADPGYADWLQREVEHQIDLL